ncbi:GNAT family N-acetyltransferase [Desulfobacca acetoxidans]|uniref:GCN5-related N-acetyltransferase n=1 Tax=Desulfobacca acetoxidans (strain ATCC 700848 / DSM 11109 / ASRB2) TaxID=880072 RepID=F2NHX9_DESAR|nr:GNAT family N-acetyltransferase [Desulfobacca acetoxidans]AEB09605.1 GCN5-related N-acetyltransferase [Desulfobacca acetoxidans DSM 11109]HAY21589.1 N-acetyltransferase [Desulfobacterales bacterium]
MQGFRKESVLKDGTKVLLRPMVSDDRDKLLDFFSRVSEQDRQFLRNDVRDPKLIDHWVNNIDLNKVFPLLAEVEGKIVGDATLHMRKSGWKRHLGNVRVVVAKDFQRRGLGSLLINEIAELAGEYGLEKLVAEIYFNAPGALNAFKRAGFGVKAVFEDLVKDLYGQNADMIVMVCDVEARKDRLRDKALA